MVNIPKGTKDVLPQNSYKWQFVEDTAKQVAQVYNVHEIRTPEFEHTELFLRSIGDETDIVTKEMYTFTDKGGRSLTLRPEGTASVVRSFIENSLDASLPLKTFYISPAFRYERPQANRYRIHHQFGVEYFGSESYDCDFEVITLALDFLNKLGIKGVTPYVNSIGCKDCRPAYNAALRAFLTAHSDNLCEPCRTRAKLNPLRALDCKVESCQKILADAPKINDYLCDNCKNHFSQLTDALQKSGANFVVDTLLVRGFDYYTKTVFEFKNSDGIAVLGGGRYDNLVSELGGKQIPCVGFGSGIERLLSVLESTESLPSEPKPDIYFAPLTTNALTYCRTISSELRKSGIVCEYDIMNRSIKAQMRYADKKAFKLIVVLGDDEINSGEVKIKRMSDGSIITAKLDNLVSAVIAELK